jgi:hypothetical protein
MTEEKIEKKYELVQVPTEHTIAVQTPEGEIISTNELIVGIANDIKTILERIG